MASLYLIPVNISDAPLGRVLPPLTGEVVAPLRHFIVENVRTARRFLRKLIADFPIDECEFKELNGHTPESVIWSYLNPLRKGHDVGLMSEAGCPAVADPGSQVVAIAQNENMKVVPLVGPSSILMALMASGFNGQGFAFCGYLPVKQSERIKRIKELESLSRHTGQTQIFIETPYRNSVLLHDLSATLQPSTLLCVASDITEPERERIRTMPAPRWRGVEMAKSPAIFLLQASK